MTVQPPHAGGGGCLPAPRLLPGGRASCWGSVVGGLAVAVSPRHGVGGAARLSCRTKVRVRMSNPKAVSPSLGRNGSGGLLGIQTPPELASAEQRGWSDLFPREETVVMSSFHPLSVFSASPALPLRNLLQVLLASCSVPARRRCMSCPLRWGCGNKQW